MKYLIAYHSKTGNNSKLAENLFQEMEANNFDVTVMKILPKINVPLPFVGLQGTMRLSQDLKTDYDLSPYQVIVLCGPVWAGGISPVLKRLIERSKSLDGKKFFISLCCLSDALEAMSRLAELIQNRGAEVVGKRRLRAQDIKNNHIVQNYTREVVQDLRKTFDTKEMALK